VFLIGILQIFGVKHHWGVERAKGGKIVVMDYDIDYVLKTNSGEVLLGRVPTSATRYVVDSKEFWECYSDVKSSIVEVTDWWHINVVGPLTIPIRSTEYFSN